MKTKYNCKIEVVLKTKDTKDFVSIYREGINEKGEMDFVEIFYLPNKKELKGFQKLISLK